MKYYLITVDIDLDNGYSKLINAIEGLGDCKFLSKTTWIVASNSSAKDIRNYLGTFIGYLDELIVAEITINMAWRINRKNGDGQQRRQDLLDDEILRKLAENG